IRLEAAPGSDTLGNIHKGKKRKHDRDDRDRTGHGKQRRRGQIGEDEGQEPHQVEGEDPAVRESGAVSSRWTRKVRRVGGRRLRWQSAPWARQRAQSWHRRTPRSPALGTDWPRRSVLPPQRSG